ncbi:MAG: helix-turn-helix domain-containing protein, partial [Candidatus Omnitrophota bacterium]
LWRIAVIGAGRCVAGSEKMAVEKIRYFHKASPEEQAKALGIILRYDLDRFGFWTLFIRTYPNTNKFKKFCIFVERETRFPAEAIKRARELEGNPRVLVKRYAGHPDEYLRETFLAMMGRAQASSSLINRTVPINGVVGLWTVKDYGRRQKKAEKRLCKILKEMGISVIRQAHSIWQPTIIYDGHMKRIGDFIDRISSGERISLSLTGGLFDDCILKVFCASVFHALFKRNEPIHILLVDEAIKTDDYDYSILRKQYLDFIAQLAVNSLVFIDGVPVAGGKKLYPETGYSVVVSIYTNTAQLRGHYPSVYREIMNSMQPDDLQVFANIARRTGIRERDCKDLAQCLEESSKYLGLMQPRIIAAVIQLLSLENVLRNSGGFCDFAADAGRIKHAILTATAKAGYNQPHAITALSGLISLIEAEGLRELLPVIERVGEAVVYATEEAGIYQGKAITALKSFISNFAIRYIRNIDDLAFVIEKTGTFTEGAGAWQDKVLSSLEGYYAGFAARYITTLPELLSNIEQIGVFIKLGDGRVPEVIAKVSMLISQGAICGEIKDTNGLNLVIHKLADNSARSVALADRFHPDAMVALLDLLIHLVRTKKVINFGQLLWVLWHIENNVLWKKKGYGVVRSLNRASIIVPAVIPKTYPIESACGVEPIRPAGPERVGVGSPINGKVVKAVRWILDRELKGSEPGKFIHRLRPSFDKFPPQLKFVQQQLENRSVSGKAAYLEVSPGSDTVGVYATHRLFNGMALSFEEILDDIGSEELGLKLIELTNPPPENLIIVSGAINPAAQEEVSQEDVMYERIILGAVNEMLINYAGFIPVGEKRLIIGELLARDRMRDNDSPMLKDQIVRQNTRLYLLRDTLNEEEIGALKLSAGFTFERDSTFQNWLKRPVFRYLVAGAVARIAVRYKISNKLKTEGEPTDFEKEILPTKTVTGDRRAIYLLTPQLYVLRGQIPDFIKKLEEIYTTNIDNLMRIRGGLFRTSTAYPEKVRGVSRSVFEPVDGKIFIMNEPVKGIKHKGVGFNMPEDFVNIAQLNVLPAVAFDKNLETVTVSAEESTMPIGYDPYHRAATEYYGTLQILFDAAIEEERPNCLIPITFALFPDIAMPDKVTGKEKAMGAVSLAEPVARDFRMSHYMTSSLWAPQIEEFTGKTKAEMAALMVLKQHSVGYELKKEHNRGRIHNTFGPENLYYLLAEDRIIIGDWEGFLPIEGILNQAPVSSRVDLLSRYQLADILHHISRATREQYNELCPPSLLIERFLSGYFGKEKYTRHKKEIDAWLVGYSVQQFGYLLLQTAGAPFPFNCPIYRLVFEENRESFGVEEEYPNPKPWTKIGINGRFKGVMQFEFIEEMLAKANINSEALIEKLAALSLNLDDLYVLKGNNSGLLSILLYTLSIRTSVFDNDVFNYMMADVRNLREKLKLQLIADDKGALTTFCGRLQYFNGESFDDWHLKNKDKITGIIETAGSPVDSENRTVPILLPPETKEKRNLTKATVTMQELFDVLEKTGGNQKAAASLLGISRQTFYTWLDKYGIDGQAIEEWFITKAIVEALEEGGTTTNAAMLLNKTEGGISKYCKEHGIDIKNHTGRYLRKNIQIQETIAALEATGCICKEAADLLGIRLTTIYKRISVHKIDLLAMREKYKPGQDKVKWDLIEKIVILAAFFHYKGEMACAAAALGVSVCTLNRKMLLIFQNRVSSNEIERLVYAKELITLGLNLKSLLPVVFKKEIPGYSQVTPFLRQAVFSIFEKPMLLPGPENTTTRERAASPLTPAVIKELNPLSVPVTDLFIAPVREIPNFIEGLAGFLMLTFFSFMALNFISKLLRGKQGKKEDSPEYRSDVQKAVSTIRIHFVLENKEKIREYLREALDRFIEPESTDAKVILSQINRLRLRHGSFYYSLLEICYRLLRLANLLATFLILKELFGYFKHMLWFPLIIGLWLFYPYFTLRKVIKAAAEEKERFREAGEAEYFYSDFYRRHFIILSEKWESSDLMHEFGHFIAVALKLKDEMDCFGEAFWYLASKERKGFDIFYAEFLNLGAKQEGAQLRELAKALLKATNHDGENCTAGPNLAAIACKLYPDNDKEAFKFLVSLFEREGEGSSPVSSRNRAGPDTSLGLEEFRDNDRFAGILVGESAVLKDGKPLIAVRITGCVGVAIIGGLGLGLAHAWASGKKLDETFEDVSGILKGSVAIITTVVSEKIRLHNSELIALSKLKKKLRQRGVGRFVVDEKPRPIIRGISSINMAVFPSGIARVIYLNEEHRAIWIKDYDFGKKETRNFWLSYKRAKGKGSAGSPVLRSSSSINKREFIKLRKEVFGGQTDKWLRLHSKQRRGGLVNGAIQEIAEDCEFIRHISGKKCDVWLEVLRYAVERNIDLGITHMVTFTSHFKRKIAIEAEVINLSLLQFVNFRTALVCPAVRAFIISEEFAYAPSEDKMSLLAMNILGLFKKERSLQPINGNLSNFNPALPPELSENTKREEIYSITMTLEQFMQLRGVLKDEKLKAFLDSDEFSGIGLGSMKKEAVVQKMKEIGLDKKISTEQAYTGFPQSLKKRVQGDIRSVWQEKGARGQLGQMLFKSGVNENIPESLEASYKALGDDRKIELMAFFSILIKATKAINGRKPNIVTAQRPCDYALAQWEELLAGQKDPSLSEVVKALNQYVTPAINHIKKVREGQKLQQQRKSGDSEDDDFASGASPLENKDSKLRKKAKELMEKLRPEDCFLEGVSAASLKECLEMLADLQEVDFSIRHSTFIIPPLNLLTRFMHLLFRLDFGYLFSLGLNLILQVIKKFIFFRDDSCTQILPNIEHNEVIGKITIFYNTKASFVIETCLKGVIFLIYAIAFSPSPLIKFALFIYIFIGVLERSAELSEPAIREILHNAMKTAYQYLVLNELVKSGMITMGVDKAAYTFQSCNEGFPVRRYDVIESVDFSIFVAGLERRVLDTFFPENPGNIKGSESGSASPVDIVNSSLIFDNTTNALIGSFIKLSKSRLAELKDATIKKFYLNKDGRLELAGVVWLKLSNYPAAEVEVLIKNGIVSRVLLVAENRWIDVPFIIDNRTGIVLRTFSSLKAEEMKTLEDATIKQFRIDALGNLHVGGRDWMLLSKYSRAPVEIDVRSGIVACVRVMDNKGNVIDTVEPKLVYDNQAGALMDSFVDLPNSRLKGYRDVTIEGILIDISGELMLGGRMWGRFAVHAGQKAQIKLKDGIVSEVLFVDGSREKMKLVFD